MTPRVIWQFEHQLFVLTIKAALCARKSEENVKSVVLLELLCNRMQLQDSQIVRFSVC
jgi:hypothetical protein